jgi:hypothetical protein
MKFRNKVTQNSMSQYTLNAIPDAKGNAVHRVFHHDWFVVITPLLLLGVIVILLTMTKDQPGDAAQLESLEAETESLTIENILLPEPGIIVVEAVNHGEEAVTVPQVMVDDAYWDFTVVPSNTITVTGIATFTLPYPWVAGEVHAVRLITSRGEAAEGEVVGGASPIADAAE